MIRRFASAACVGAAAVALAALAEPGIPFPDDSSRYLITSIWCFIPAIWGVWAILAPKSWVPAKLPLWGALLGLILGVLFLFVFDVPGRMGLVEVTTWWKGVVLPFIVILYGLLWSIVRVVYRALVVRMAPEG